MWNQVADSALSLSIPEQEQLCRLCPYLKEPIDNHVKSLFYMFAWFSQNWKVDEMDPTCFIFPKWKKELRNRIERER